MLDYSGLRNKVITAFVQFIIISSCSCNEIITNWDLQNAVKDFTRKDVSYVVSDQTNRTCEIEFFNSSTRYMEKYTASCYDVTLEFNKVFDMTPVLKYDAIMLVLPKTSKCMYYKYSTNGIAITRTDAFCIKKMDEQALNFGDTNPIITLCHTPTDDGMAVCQEDGYSVRYQLEIYFARSEFTNEWLKNLLPCSVLENNYQVITRTKAICIAPVNEFSISSNGSLQSASLGVTTLLWLASYFYGIL